MTRPGLLAATKPLPVNTDPFHGKQVPNGAVRFYRYRSPRQAKPVVSIAAMVAVFNADLPPSEKLLMLVLADNAQGPGGQGCYPAVATMARKSSMSVRTVQRTLASLVAGEWIIDTGQVSHYGTKVWKLNIAGLEGTTAPLPSRAKCPPGLRAQVIAAFHLICSYCGEQGDMLNGPDGQPWNVDRIIPGQRGGEYSPDNVTLSCGKCNRKKRASTPDRQPTSLADLWNDPRQNDAPRQNGTPAKSDTQGVPPVAHESADENLHRDPPPSTDRPVTVQPVTKESQMHLSPQAVRRAEKNGKPPRAKSLTAQVSQQVSPKRLTKSEQIDADIATLGERMEARQRKAQS